MTNLSQAETTSIESLGTSFLIALTHRDFDELTRFFDPHVRSRLLIPAALITPPDAMGVSARFRQWFGEADHFEMTDSQLSTLGKRLAMFYTLKVHERERWFVVQQQTYSDVRNGCIETFDLLCSGFQPVPAPAQE